MDENLQSENNAINFETSKEKIFFMQPLQFNSLATAKGLVVGSTTEDIFYVCKLS